MKREEYLDDYQESCRKTSEKEKKEEKTKT